MKYRVTASITFESQDEDPEGIYYATNEDEAIEEARLIADEATSDEFVYDVVAIPDRKEGRRMEERYYIYDAETNRMFTVMATSTDDATRKFVEWDMEGDPEAVREITNEAAKTGWDGYAQDRGLRILKTGDLEDITITRKEAKKSRFVDGNLDGMTLHRKYGCPICGETRVEFLHENEGGIIDCASCGAVYDPIEEATERRNREAWDALLEKRRAEIALEAGVPQDKAQADWNSLDIKIREAIKIWENANVEYDTIG